MGTAAKAIVIISVIFVANSVSAGSIAWTSSPEHGCKQWDGPESYDELLAVITEIDASEQRDVKLLKNETSDRGRTFITKTNGNYLVFMDSKELCEERIASFKSNQKPIEEQTNKSVELDAFAYAYHPGLKMHIALFRSECPIKDDSWEGQAKMESALYGNKWEACWGWMNNDRLSIGVCPINAEKEEIGECIYISKDHFKDVAEMKKRMAFK